MDELSEDIDSRSKPISRKMKLLIDQWLAASDYDGIILEKDKGSGGTVKTIVALNSNQVKSAETGTERENIGTFSRYEERIDYSKDLNVAAAAGASATP